jgi:hypothetical protein
VTEISIARQLDRSIHHRQTSPSGAELHVWMVAVRVRSKAREVDVKIEGI